MAGNELPGDLVRTHSDTSRFKYFRISNQERISGTPYDFQCAFGNDIILDHIIDLHLHSLSIPNIGNNISASIGNNVFSAVFTIAGPLSIVIPDGYYSSSAIMAYLQTQINAFIAPSVISVTQSPLTNLITFAITSGPETMQILAYPTLGIYNNSAPAQTSVSATSVPSLVGSTYYFVHSTELGSNDTYIISNTGNVNDVNGIFSVPVNVPYGVNQTFQADNENDQIVFGISSRSMRRFQITLRTNHGRLLTELPDNLEVIIILKLFWRKNM